MSTRESLRAGFTVSTRFPFRLTAEGKNFTIDEVRGLDMV